MRRSALSLELPAGTAGRNVFAAGLAEGRIGEPGLDAVEAAARAER